LVVKDKTKSLAEISDYTGGYRLHPIAIKIMNCAELVKALRERIETSLTPLITADYWLMEIPHYDNVGDTLIWQGEMDFLKGLSHKCRGMRALDSWRCSDIKEGEMILFQGGGNFGDLWPKHHDFKMKVVAEHPKNRFLFFPQTVYFEHAENMHRCAEFLSHYDVTICARDSVSYELLKGSSSFVFICRGCESTPCFEIALHCWQALRTPSDNAIMSACGLMSAG